MCHNIRIILYVYHNIRIILYVYHNIFAYHNIRIILYVYLIKVDIVLENVIRGSRQEQDSL